MNAERAFLDTNVLLYTLSGNPGKADRAEALLAAGGVVSVQVLNEFASVTRRKLAMDWAEIRDALSAVRGLCEVVPITVETHDDALALAARYGFSLYDALIVAAALRADAAILYTEDLQHGQRLEDRLTVLNPFRAAAAP